MVASKVKVLRGIQLEKVDKKILKAYLDKRGIEHKSDAVVDMVEAYGARVEEEVQASGEPPASCAVCGAIAVEELDQCPVCGDVDAGDEEEAEGEPVHQGEIQSSVAEVQLAEGDDITASISRLRTLLSGAMTNYWRLGRELRDCYERKLYKTIIDESTQQPRYESWDHFVEAELGITGGHARQLAAASIAVSEEQFAQLGVEKVRIASRLAAKLPAAEQSAVFTAAAEKSVRELREEVRKSKQQPAGSKPPAIEEPPPEAKKAARKKKVVTCTLEVGKVEVPLRVAEAGAKVKTFIGSEELMDGVRIFYEVQIKARTAVLVRKAERVEPEAE